VFVRLHYFGRVQMGLGEDEFWFMPIGLFLDLWTCHKQFVGMEKPKKNWTIDEIIPLDI